MFWSNIYAINCPHIDALLEKEDTTLYQLMDQEEIIPECKSQNKKLVDFLTKPEIIEELVMLIIKEPAIEIDEKWRYKYPNVACELLTCNVPSLNDKLAGSENLLEKLYSFIDTDQELNPLLASFFSKIIGFLLTRKSDQVLEFLKSREKCVDRLLQHLETSAIMDLILKLVTKVEGPDMRQNILNWLDTEKLVQQLIKTLSSSCSPVKHTNAAQLLCDIIKSARDYRLTCTERTEPDPILNTLESEEIISLLLDTILTGEPLESSIVGGIQVLLVLLGQETNIVLSKSEGNNSGDQITDNVDRAKIQNATLPYLEQFQKLLLNPPLKPAVKTTAGLLENPLGNTRLHIAKLFTALLSTGNIKVFQKFADLETFQTLLDLFFKYSWNNFLHTQVEQCLGLVINEDWQENNSFVYTHIICQCKLIHRILEAWDTNDKKQNKEKGVRQGYMGHLVCIANHIVQQCEKNQDFDKHLKEKLDPEFLQQWETLVNTQLAEINKIHEMLLGGKAQPYMTSEDSTEDFNNYSQDAYIQQQVYANYQGQQMTSNFIDPYTYHDDDFNDGNDALQPSNSVDQINPMTFTLKEEDLVEQEEAFNKICQQKQKAGLDEEWGDEDALTFQTVIDRRDWTFKQQQQHDSLSSDEDEETKDNMEIDSNEFWDSSDRGTYQTVLGEVNPWNFSETPAEESSGWANFDNFNPCSPFDVQTSQSNLVATDDNDKDKVPETTINKNSESWDTNSKDNKNETISISSDNDIQNNSHDNETTTKIPIESMEKMKI